MIFAGALAYWLLGALTSVVRATGQVAILAYVYVGAEVLHIALVPALVFGLGPIPALGITGAGLATVISFAASTRDARPGTSPRAGRRSTLSLRGIRFERRLFGEILRVGAPMSLAPVLNNVALATLTAYAGLLGATSLAAFGAAVRLEYLLYPLNFGLGAAVLAMVGSNIGARQFARAARIAWTAVGTFGLRHGLASACWRSPRPTSGWACSAAIRRSLPRPPVTSRSSASPIRSSRANTLMSAFQSTRQPQWPLAAMTCRLLVVVVGRLDRHRGPSGGPRGAGRGHRPRPRDLGHRAGRAPSASTPA